METNFLIQLGLTQMQAEAYLFLMQNGPHTPPALARCIKESRTNTYNILERLLDLGLVKRYEEKKKYVFQAEPPTLLERLASEKRENVMQQERHLHAAMPALLAEYFSGNEKPGVKFFQGENELKQIYDDQIITAEPIYIIRPDYNMDLYDFSYMSELRHRARKAGIKRYAITPDRTKAPKNFKESDPFMLLQRTWIKANDYTAPVEWNAYGNKLAVMSFGDEAIGMIIESPQIAESFRQLYKLLEEGIRRRPDYNELPLKAKYMAAVAEESNQA